MKILSKLIGVLALILFSQVSYANGAGTTYVNSCGVFQSTGETLIVTNDIVAPSGDDCIFIWASEVTLDCQGHRITGTGVNDGYSGVLVKADNVTVRNCELNNWSTGIEIEAGMGDQILQNKVFDNTNGITLFPAFDALVYQNKADNNQRFGIVLLNAFRNNIVDNTVHGSGISGIQLVDSGETDENGNFVLGNQTNKNGEDGIRLDNGSKSNRVVHNTSNLNQENGIRLSILSVNNMVENNTFNKNRFYGILSAGGTNYYDGNRCRKNDIEDSAPAGLCK